MYTHQNLILTLAIVSALTVVTEAKKFSRCEFVRIARKHFPAHEISQWTCIVQHESSFNTKAVNVNKDRSRDHGLFQISNIYWCSPGKYNKCKVSCKDVMSDNLAKAIKCAKMIKRQQGFQAWAAWNNKCKGRNLASYVRGC